MTLSLFLAGVSLWSPAVIPQRTCLVGPPWKTTESGNSTREGPREILCFYPLQDPNSASQGFRVLIYNMIRLSQMLGINAFSGTVVHLETKPPKGSNGPGTEQEDNNLPGQNTPFVCIPIGWLSTRLLMMALHSDSESSLVY